MTSEAALSRGLSEMEGVAWGRIKKVADGRPEKVAAAGAAESQGIPPADDSKPDARRQARQCGPFALGLSNPERYEPHSPPGDALAPQLGAVKKRPKETPRQA